MTIDEQCSVNRQYHREALHIIRKVTVSLAPNQVEQLSPASSSKQTNDYETLAAHRAELQLRPESTKSSLRVPLFKAFTPEPTLEARRDIAEEMQEIVYGQSLTMPFGQFARPANYRFNLSQFIPAAISLFWNVEKQ